MLKILRYQMKVFYQQSPDGHQHPAVLLAMVVDGARLTHLPANGNELIERCLIDQVAGVVLAVPGEKGVKTGGGNCCAFKKRQDIGVMVKSSRGKLPQLGGEILDRNLLGNS